MPFYKFPGFANPVHVRGTKLPPACGEAVGILTSDGESMQVCGAWTHFQCDWPTTTDIAPGRAQKTTCDRHICEAHVFSAGTNKHYCPMHAREHLDSQSQPGLFTTLVQS